jgi:hypothetical protein
MSDREPLSPEIRALLDRERELPSVPAAQRARAMARARSALAAGGAALAAGGASAGAPTRARPGKRWAAAAAALLASAAVGAAAYEIRARFAQVAQPPHVAPAPRPTRVVASAPAALAPAVTVEQVAPAPEPQVAAPGLSRAEAARAELRLLRDARAAVARRDFAAALVPIGEHTRLFKNGRLAEEREALRVKALSGLGRTEEARRAAGAFRTRFPRSVLLPAVSQMPASQP